MAKNKAPDSPFPHKSERMHTDGRSIIGGAERTPAPEASDSQPSERYPEQTGKSKNMPTYLT